MNSNFHSQFFAMLTASCTCLWRGFERFLNISSCFSIINSCFSILFTIIAFTLVDYIVDTKLIKVKVLFNFFGGPLEAPNESKPPSVSYHWNCDTIIQLSDKWSSWIFISNFCHRVFWFDLIWKISTKYKGWNLFKVQVLQKDACRKKNNKKIIRASYRPPISLG